MTDGQDEARTLRPSTGHTGQDSDSTRSLFPQCVWSRVCPCADRYALHIYTGLVGGLRLASSYPFVVSTLILETGSLGKPGTQFTWSAWPVNPKDPPVSVPGAWIIGMHYTYLTYVGARGSNSDPHAYITRSLYLPTLPSPSPLLYWQTEGCGVSS